MASLAELGEIAKGAPRYIKDVMAGKVVRPNIQVERGPSGPYLNEAYVRVNRATRGKEAARSKAMGDESGYRGSRIYGETYGRIRPGQPAGPDLQERLTRYKRDKFLAAREAGPKAAPPKPSAASAPPPPRAEPPPRPSAPPPKPRPETDRSSSRRWAAPAAVGGGLAIGGTGTVGYHRIKSREG